MFNQLIILCGGRGTRLKEISGNIPKAMLPVFNRPFLDYLLRRVSVLPFEEIVLLGGYLGDQIYSSFHGEVYNGIPVKVVIDQEVGGTLLALHSVQDRLADNVWICNGDTFFNFSNFLLFRNVFFDESNLNYLFSVDVNNVDRYGAISYDDSNTIVSFTEKGAGNGTGKINSGFVKLKRADILCALQDNGTSLELDLLRSLVQQGRLKVVNGALTNFIDFGVPEDFARLEERISGSFPSEAIFWDRDGTINQDTGYTYKLEDYCLMNYLETDSVAFKNSRYLNFVVTNQSGIARGLYSDNDVYRFHHKMKLDFLDRGWKVDDLRFCPHHEEGIIEKFAIQCACRKPCTAMFEELLQRWSLCSSDTKFIGNSLSDKNAAVRMGIPYLSVNKNDFDLKKFREFVL